MCVLNIFYMTLISSLILFNKVNTERNDKVLIVTVATNETNGYERYLRSAHVYGIEPVTLGLGQQWKGGNVKRYAGGGQKVNLLRDYLEQYKENDDKILLFTDSYDVIFLSNLDAIVEQFLSFNARILFSAEEYCWPDKSLSKEYPHTDEGKPYLNSGLFIGYTNNLYKIISTSDLEDGADDQLFYTKVYLDETTRNEHKIKLDHTSVIFQNLYGAIGDVQIKSENEEPYLENTETKTKPLILHGNGASKLVFNSLSNYLAKSYNFEEGCVACWENNIHLNELEISKYPSVLIAVFIERATPFMEEFFDKVNTLEYPKNKIHLFIHNNEKYHEKLVDDFIQKSGLDYKSIKQIKPDDEINEWNARNLALDYCLTRKCDYYFNIDSDAQLDNAHTLKLLIEQNRTVVGPMLVRPGRSWSNFWGALTNDGFYARSFDYMDIVHNERRGLWNVPFISTCYLVNATLIRQFDRTKISYIHDQFDADMSFCSNLRDLDIFMYVSNRLDFGHLVNPETFDISRTAPEMYQIFDNRFDWEQRYILKNYSDNFKSGKTHMQPCPDVYWFPVTTKRFCKDLINMMEAFGQWSDGKNNDPRLDSGYEAVPTRDIHMNQVGWDKHWLHFLKEFVRPLQEMIFIGYFHDPPRSLMNFVVRYRPDEQPFLRPHHDSSTYTINLALNTPGVDFEGGGCRFLRYNCSVVDTKPGWLLMHPGRLTHYHEGLLVTKGTRYIMVSFVDP